MEYAKRQSRLARGRGKEYNLDMNNLTHTLRFVAIAVCIAAVAHGAETPAVSGEADVASYVDTRIGGSYRGHTFPGATCPFSLVQASPDTGLCDWDHCSGYVWEDKFVYGFSQTHLSGTGCPDLADVRILPFSAGFADGDPVQWRQAKDFGSEKGTPGYYTVSFTNDGIFAEATATPRVGVYRFTYAAGKPVKLLVDLQWVNAGAMRKAVVEFENALGVDGRSISGGRRTHAWLRRSVYWKVVFDRPWTKAMKLPKAQPTEKGDRYVLEFAPGAPLVVKAAISTVDKDGAAKNYAAEAEGRSFDEVRAAAKAKWNALLSRMQVPGASAEQRTAFYTALYHLFIQPNDIADVDGRYRGGDAKVATAKGGAYYTGLSLWDTFRAAHPFYTLAIPERVDGFVNSMLGHYRALGFLPVIPYFGWESYCMIGNHSVPVIVDAYLKGFRGFDADLAFEAVTNSLTVTHRNLDGKPKIKEEWELYDRYGYYPFDKIRGESISRTLECGFNDWCAAQLCAALGRGDEAFFRRRSGYWKNVFDASTGFMRGKDTQGKWRDPFDPFQLGHDHNRPNDFTEGNAFQYTWHVLQDPIGLIAAMGGKDAFVKKLDALFVQPERTEGMGFVGDVTGLIGQYAHGNEPSHHVAYFYPFAGRPDRTAEVVREVCDRFYGVKPGDLCGNDDCGQMSAWYVFAAMGFYPFNPCGGDYVLGAPQFPKVTLALPGGKTFTVVAKNLSRENKYVKSVTFRPLNASTSQPLNTIIRHADIVRGGELVFEMCASRDAALRRPAPVPRRELETAVARPVLPSVLAGSSELLAMSALAETDIAADEAWRKVKTPEEMAARQKAMRASFLAALGGLPERTPLQARTTGTVLLEEGIGIEKVLFASQSNFWVSGNVYVPRADADFRKPYPALLVPCGHTDNGKAAASYQYAGIAGARAGFLTLVYDPVDQGERVVSPDRVSWRGHNWGGALADRLGWSFGRIRVWDAMRALDYLQERPDVDKEKLCVYGISGGGTATALVMSLDDRVKAAAPACYLSTIHDTFESRFPSDAEQEHFGQLTFGLNHLGYLLLRAPSPVLVCCTLGDIFPYRGMVATYAAAQDVVGRFGWSDRIALIRGTCGHYWTEGSRMASLDWFRRWVNGERDALRADFDSYRAENVGLNLGGKDYGFVQKQIATFQEERELYATPEGRTCSLPGARTVHDLLKDELASLEAARKGGILEPKTVAALAGIRLAGRPIARPNVLAIEKLPGVTVERMSFFSSDGAQFPAVLLVPDSVTAQPTIICGDGPRASRIERARNVLADGSPVLLPDLCGWGEIGRFARKFSAQAVPDETLAMTWYPLGRSLVGIRAENIIDCATALAARFSVPRLVACGRAVIPAVHARFVAPAAFSDAVEMLDKPPAWAEEVRSGAKANFADSVHGALAVYDWPQL